MEDKKKSKEGTGNNGKTVTTDDPNTFPCNVIVHCQKSWSTIGSETQVKTRGGTQPEHFITATQKDRTAGNSPTPYVIESRSLFAAANRTAIARIFTSLSLAVKIVDAIVDKQG